MEEERQLLPVQRRGGGWLFGVVGEGVGLFGVVGEGVGLFGVVGEGGTF